MNKQFLELLKAGKIIEANQLRLDNPNYNPNLKGADLTDTILDPEKSLPTFDITGFETDNNNLIGYRSKRSLYYTNNIYAVGETYTAPYFSCCDKTECHPGLYFYKSIEELKLFDSSIKEIVKVSVDPLKAIKAGSKYRCKEFTVIEEMS
jgi:hypothetical protein